MNIVWSKPDGESAVTWLADGVDPVSESDRLKQTGAIPMDWNVTGYDIQISIAQSIPTVVAMRQARLALLQSGLLAQVNSAISAMAGTEGEAARIEWEYAQEIRRDHSLVQALKGQLGLTEAQLDELFTLAATL